MSDTLLAEKPRRQVALEAVLFWVETVPGIVWAILGVLVFLWVFSLGTRWFPHSAITPESLGFTAMRKVTIWGLLSFRYGIPLTLYAILMGGVELLVISFAFLFLSSLLVFPVLGVVSSLCKWTRTKFPSSEDSQK